MARISRMPDVRLERQSALRARRMRRPSHPFRLKLRPWQIVPCLFAPVLPGDTVKSYSMQARVLSDPIADKLAGWWCEFYMFYVRANDLQWDGYDMTSEFQQLLIAGTDPTIVNAADQYWYYSLQNTPAWLGTAYERVVRDYFWNEAVDPTTDDTDRIKHSVGEYYSSRIVSSAWWDSIATDEALEAGGIADPETWEGQWTAYQKLRNARLTTATWEEYLAMQGVSSPPVLTGGDKRNRRPELLRFHRDFQYPVQAVEPTTGVPSALVQWSMADRLTRGRVCAEPGFLLGLMVCRPKTYLRLQKGNATETLMSRAEAWLPSALDTDPHARMRLLDPSVLAEDLVDGALGKYWLDPKDLLDRGDQFINYDLSGGRPAGVNTVELPVVAADGTLNPAFPSGTDADNCFSGTNKAIYVDGICTFQIASRSGGSDATGRGAAPW